MDSEGILIGLITVLVVGIFVTMLLVGLGIPERMECKTYAALYEGALEFNYTYWTGCLVKAPNGKWVDVDEFMQYYGDLHTLQFGNVGE